MVAKTLIVSAGTAWYNPEIAGSNLAIAPFPKRQ